ncbi:MAG: hypothetical protein BWY64_00977 [bacterium ADurb.Bin363]|nr:MAG: hypothetical protein BWY64_00977 [bacterium ADurb.Bin363]
MTSAVIELNVTKLLPWLAPKLFPTMITVLPGGCVGGSIDIITGGDKGIVGVGVTEGVAVKTGVNVGVPAVGNGVACPGVGASILFTSTILASTCPPLGTVTIVVP